MRPARKLPSAAVGDYRSIARRLGINSSAPLVGTAHVRPVRPRRSRQVTGPTRPGQQGRGSRSLPGLKYGHRSPPKQRVRAGLVRNVTRRHNGVPSPSQRSSYHCIVVVRKDCTESPQFLRKCHKIGIHVRSVIQHCIQWLYLPIATFGSASRRSSPMSCENTHRGPVPPVLSGPS